MPCVLCGVIRVEFQHLNVGDGSSSGNRLREGSGNTLRRVYFQVELGKINFGTIAVVLQAISGTTIRLDYFRVKNRVKIDFVLCCAASDAAWQYQWSRTDDFFRNGYAHAASIRPQPLSEAPFLSPSLACYLPASHPPCLPPS